MALFTVIPGDALFVDRENALDPLATFSKHDFFLDELTWPSVEHYFQGMKFDDLHLRRRIALAQSPHQARRIARWHFWKRRRDWKKVQVVVMTRGVYLKCRTHDDARQALLDTGDNAIVESSLYDHFWGCGRDQRGHNHYGKVLMDVRARLRSEMDSTQM